MEEYFHLFIVGSIFRGVRKERILMKCKTSTMQALHVVRVRVCVCVCINFPLFRVFFFLIAIIINFLVIP